MPLYFTSLAPSSSSSSRILYRLPFLPHIIQQFQYLYKPALLLLHTKIRRYYLNYASKSQIKLTILLCIRCVVVSEKLHSQPYPKHKSSFFSGSTSIDIYLTFRSASACRDRTCLFLFACAWVSPSVLRSCYCAEPSLERSFLPSNIPSRTPTYKPFSPPEFILHPPSSHKDPSTTYSTPFLADSSLSFTSFSFATHRQSSTILVIIRF